MTDPPPAPLSAFPARRPPTRAALGELVREARAAGQALYPFGGGTQLHRGYAPTRPGFTVDLRELNEVVDYPARDLTITVGAGMTVATLQAMLAKEGQRLPVEVPRADVATIGGSVAANVSGPRRLSQGTFRDCVLGVAFVADDGSEARGGGRVVKNVAGYDLMKLHCGAFGTLGILTELTLKVIPRPEAQAAVTFGIGYLATEIEAMLVRLQASHSRPRVVELLNAAAARRVGLTGDSTWYLVAGFEEKADTVQWQVRTLLDDLAGTDAKDVQTLDGPAAGRLLDALVEQADPPDALLSFRSATRPSQLNLTAAYADDSSHQLVLQAHAQNGILLGHWPAGSAKTLMQVQSILMVLDEPAHLTIGRHPAAWQYGLPLWGNQTGPAWDLMRLIKLALDPDDVFNPGRFFRPPA